jgi:hypothetical protein
MHKKMHFCEVWVEKEGFDDEVSNWLYENTIEEYKLILNLTEIMDIMIN